MTKLKLLSNFFESVDLISISIKTEIIHNHFEENKSIDFNKLEIFHLQYTDSLIELLNKIKKKIEIDILKLMNELEINKQYLSDFKIGKLADFETERRIYSGLFSVFAGNIYGFLNQDISTLNWNDVLFFSQKFASEFYRVIPNEHSFKIENINCYKCQEYKIERKLLGKLNIQKFKCRFICGYRNNKSTYELFKIFQTEEYFIFSIEDKELYLIDNVNFTMLDISSNVSNKVVLINQLRDRNEELKKMINNRKHSLPNDVQHILEDYYQNLSGIGIISNTSEINEEVNFLRAMLNLNLNN